MVNVKSFLENTKNLSGEWLVTGDIEDDVPLYEFRNVLKYVDDSSILKLNGLPVWYIVIQENLNKVELNTKADIDLESEINFVFAEALKGEMDELHAFLYLLENGVTLDDFTNIGKGDYAETFMKEHGLV